MGNAEDPLGAKASSNLTERKLVFVKEVGCLMGFNIERYRYLDEGIV